MMSLVRFYGEQVKAKSAVIKMKKENNQQLMEKVIIILEIEIGSGGES